MAEQGNPAWRAYALMRGPSLHHLGAPIRSWMMKMSQFLTATASLRKPGRP